MNAGNASINNAENQNVLSVNMMSRIQSELDESLSNNKIRVIIISAEGDIFSAGHDLKELKDGRNNSDKGKTFFKEVMTQCSKMMQSIVNNPKPVIAEVGGIATAAGCQLVASCDLAYASSSAKFATPGVNIGLFCSTPMVALTRNVSKKHSMEAQGDNKSFKKICDEYNEYRKLIDIWRRHFITVRGQKNSEH